MQSVSVQATQLYEACREPQSLNLFAALLLGNKFKHEFPEAHQAYWQLLTEAALSGKTELYYALGLPRGFAKTTLIKLFTCWLLIYTPFRFPVIVSASGNLAINVLRDICDMLDSPNVLAVYGNWRSEIVQDSQDQKVFTFLQKKCALVAIGAESSVRGLNIHNERPDVIIAEDAQSKDCALSETQNNKFIDWFFSTLLMARSSERSLCVFIGNMYNETCMLNQLRQSPDWVSLISAGILSNGESLWPEFRTKESLLAEYTRLSNMKTPLHHLFLAEVMNDPTALENKWFDSTKIPQYHLPENAYPACSYIIIDPATGKKTGDDTTIGLTEVHSGVPVIRKIDSGKYGDTETVERGLLLALENGVSLIAVEEVAYQVSLQYYFQRVMREKKISGIRIVGVKPKGISKNQRISNFFLKWTKGEVDVHPEARPHVLAQARSYNPVMRDNKDDILDVCGYAEPVLSENWQYLYSAVQTFDAQPIDVPSVYETSLF